MTGRLAWRLAALAVTVVSTSHSVVAQSVAQSVALERSSDRHAVSPAGLPPVHPLGPVEARASEPLGSLTSVRALPGGRLLVNDITRRRVLLYDSTLASFRVVADSTSATGTAYSGSVGGLISYHGDSTLFVDPFTLSMLVITPTGELRRVLAVPRSNDAFALTDPTLGTPGFDAKERLVYRAQPQITMRGNPNDGGVMAPVFPDSTPLLRADLATRRVDTVSFVKAAVPKVSVSRDASGRAAVSTVVKPLEVVDDWAVLTDGTVIVLRGRDFHADVVGADGVLHSAPRMPHEWQRMSDEDKVALLDSTRVAMMKQPGGPAGTPIAATNFVSVSDLPDYKPPFAAGATRADLDGHVWVRLIPTKPMPGPVYAVIDGRGTLVDRVLLPAGATVVGFGPGGTVYFAVHDSAGVRLHRARADIR